MIESSGNIVWKKLSVNCLFERAPLISSILEESGALSVSIPVSDADRTVIDALFDMNFNDMAVVKSQLQSFNCDDSEFLANETT